MHYGGRALVRTLELDDHELFIAGEDFQTRRLDPRAFSIRFVETDRDIHDIRERDEAENRKHEVKVLFRESTAWRPCAKHDDLVCRPPECTGSIPDYRNDHGNFS